MMKNTLLVILAFMLGITTVNAQLAGSITYDFTDGTIITAKESPDGRLTLGGDYIYHGTGYGLDLKVGEEINISVSGNCTIKFLGSEYSGLDVKGTAVTDGDLGTQVGKVVNDKVDTFDFTYEGGPAVLNFITVAATGNDLYLPSIEVITDPPAKGSSFSFNFADDSELVNDAAIKLTTATMSNGFAMINSNGGTEFYWHDASHGVAVYNSTTFDVMVAGNAIVTFITCQYGAAGATFDVTDSEGTALGSIAAKNDEDVDADPVTFSYSGDADILTFTLVSTGENYIHGLSVENEGLVPPSNGKIDVWDFGAEQLDGETYNNHIDSALVNSWYAESITPGTGGNTLPNFAAGVLSFVGGGNDRLRTTNTSLTRYDEQCNYAPYTGRVYINGSAQTGRYISLPLGEDDEVKMVALSQNGTGVLNFVFVADPAAQTDVYELTNEPVEYNFVAKQEGVYRFYDNQDKPSYFRVYRKDAVYTTMTGAVTAPAEIPNGYEIVFTNEAGKMWSSAVTAGNYSVTLPTTYTYELSLADANGYVITNGSSLEVTEATTDYDITIEQVELYTASGNITGLGAEISGLALTYTPDPAANKIFMPEPVIDAGAGTYSVQLEPNVEYTIAATGVNDSYIPDNTITVTGDESVDVAFSPKPTNAITINATGISVEQLADLELTFTNLNEEGYSYNFTSVEGIALRDGTYSIAYNGLDAYTVELQMTSNLTVNGEAVTKDLVFNKVTNWTFDDKPISGALYKGLQFTGNIGSEVAKGHLTGKSGATIQVPVSVGDKIRVTYYYSADFSIEGTQYTTSSSSTTLLEYAEYAYTGTEDGTVTITIGSGASTSYFPGIAIGGIIEYQEVITVGADKDYQTINEALYAIAIMNRTSDQRVTVMIDPGNYEEMLVINLPNVTLKNASDTPSIALSNAGVDIDANAVRITSYYGHGYSYYSMKSNQKWDADILRVNKENGYHTYDNKGAGTTNGSYWNATVVVSASGFVADGIIFENSFNQYISAKEADDVIVMWDSGSKGERPTDAGNTAVQSRSFVERAAAIAFLASADKAIMNKCRVVGRQDSFYGDAARVVVYKGAMMGAVDYIFGAMTAVFYQSDLVMNVSDDSNDASYLTAAYQDGGRGYLMYECNVVSATPGTETASSNKAKPGYFGRPWKANTSEVVFYNTNVATTDYPGSVGESLIAPIGWNNSLGGESPYMYEYGTVEESGTDNSGNRAAWSTVLETPVLEGDVDITTFNFTKGNDDWDPIPELIANDPETGIFTPEASSAVQVRASGNRIFVSNVTSITRVDVYNANGILIDSREIIGNTNFSVSQGLWIVKVSAADGQKAVKVLTR